MSELPLQAYDVSDGLANLPSVDSQHNGIMMMHLLQPQAFFFTEKEEVEQEELEREYPLPSVTGCYRSGADSLKEGWSFQR